MELVTYAYYVRCRNTLAAFQTTCSDEKLVIAETGKEIKGSEAVYSAPVLVQRMN